MQILIVEPRKDPGAHYCRKVEELGHTAVLTTWAREAFRLLEERTFDAVVASEMVIDVPGSMLARLLERTRGKAGLPCLALPPEPADAEALVAFVRSLGG